MIKLKVHDKPFNEYADIDKFLVVPKKLWDDIKAGEITLKLNESRVKVRVYDIPCNCVGKMHQHRLVDLRSVFDKLGLKEADELTVEK